MRGAIELLDAYSVEVVGLQELERPQRQALLSLAGNRYAVYSPGGATANSIAWRRDRWALVSADSFPIPYHGGFARDMPIVRLRNVGTGQDFIFVNVHNPADTAKFPHNARFRAEALRREIAMSRSLASRYDLPIVFTGDFNDRTQAFCALTSGGVLTAAAGGSNSHHCITPSYNGIDWIFGSPDVRWAGHSAVRSSVVAGISDHPLVVARVELPASANPR
jgi:endonuclease/exonuclease/phosphatase family metal-dependent hydrolase